MPEAHKTVFISYRRSVSTDAARALFLDLRYHGYDVFLDVDSINSGAFDTIILRQIEARAHFLLILTPGSVERCADAGDWLRREIEHAMDTERNVVPLFYNGFSFGGTDTYLTGKLAGLSRYNGLTVPHEYFDAAMDKLRTRFLQMPVYVTVTPTPASDQAAVQQKIAAAAAPAQQMSAEDYVDRGNERYNKGDYDGAMADYSEAIQLNPQNPDVYYKRGRAYNRQRNHKAAIADLQRYLNLGGKDRVAAEADIRMWRLMLMVK